MIKTILPIKFQIGIFYLILYVSSFYLFVGNEIFPPLAKFYSIIYFSLEGIFIILGLTKIVFVKQTFIKVLFVVFLLLSTVTFYLNYPEITWTTHLNGLRGYVSVFTGYIFIEWIRNTKYRLIFEKKFRTFIWVFLLFQIPASLYQYAKYGAGDNVGGTLSTGFSGVLTCMIILLVFYQLTIKMRKVKYSSFRIGAFWPLIPFMIPIFINETKITFFLVPLMVFLLVKYSMNNIGRNISLLLFSIIFLVVFNNVYHAVSQEGTPLSYDKIYSKKFFSQYFFDKDEISDEKDIGRLERFYLYTEILSKNNANLFFGKGYGLFKGSSFLGESDFSKENKQLVSGSNISIAMMYMEGGIVSVLLCISLLFLILKSRFKYIKNFCGKRLFIFLILTLALSLFYNRSYFSYFYMVIVFYILLFLPNGASKVKRQYLNNNPSPVRISY